MSYVFINHLWDQQTDIAAVSKLKTKQIKLYLFY